MSDKKRRTVTLEEENHEFLKQEDNASAVVNDLVDQYRRNGDRGTAGIDLQLKQKMRALEDKREEVKRLERDVEELEALRREFQREENAELQEARDVLANAPRDPENEAIQTWAKKLGLTPEELIEELP